MALGAFLEAKYASKTNFPSIKNNNRPKHKITLREFCRKIRIDPSNWSKLERGELPLSKIKTVLTEVAQILDIRKDSEGW